MKSESDSGLVAAALGFRHGEDDRLEPLGQVLEPADVALAELLVARAAATDLGRRGRGQHSGRGGGPQRALELRVLQKRRRRAAAVAVPRAVVVRVMGISAVGVGQPG